MKQNRPSQPALLIHVLLIMVFAMGMFSIQPSVVVEAASIVAQPGAEKTTFLLPVDLVSTDSLASVGAAENPDAVPNFVVDPQYDHVEVYNWTPDSPIKLMVDGTLVATADSNAEGRVSFGYDAPRFDIAAGQVVKVSGGGIIMKHTVAKLKVKSINTLTNTVTGKAAAGSEVTVGIPNYGMNFLVSKNVTTGADGIWQVDFSGTADLVPRQWVGVKQFDGNGNATYMEWRAPDPKIFAYYEKDEISGWGWWSGAKVTLTIDSYKATTTVDKDGDFVFDLAGILDVQPGDEVSISDATITKEMTIANLSITSIDEDADTISGIADPGASVEMIAFARDSDMGFFNSVHADSFGNWTADYSGVVEISSGTHGWVEQVDEDGDCTDIDYTIPDPPFLTTLSKTFAIAGQPAMKLIANGSNFRRASSIWWGGMELDTTFISKNQLSFKLEQAKLAVSGDYFLRAVTQPGGVASSPLIFQVIETTPAYNGKLTSNYVNFDWSDITGATGYKIQLSPKSDFSTLLVNTKTIVSTYDGYITPLPRGKTYYWRIKPIYGDVSGAWSVALPFNTQDPLAKPILQSPGNKVVITDDNTPTLDWDPVTNGVNYLVQISKLVDFSTTYFKATTSNTEFETNPLPNGKYFWRVRALDLDGIKGPWSEVRMFKIALP